MSDMHHFLSNNALVYGDDEISLIVKHLNIIENLKSLYHEEENDLTYAIDILSKNTSDICPSQACNGIPCELHSNANINFFRKRSRSEAMEAPSASIESSICSSDNDPFSLPLPFRRRRLTPLRNALEIFHSSISMILPVPSLSCSSSSRFLTPLASYPSQFMPSVHKLCIPPHPLQPSSQIKPSLTHIQALCPKQIGQILSPHQLMSSPILRGAEGIANAPLRNFTPYVNAGLTCLDPIAEDTNNSIHGGYGASKNMLNPSISSINGTLANHAFIRSVPFPLGNPMAQPLARLVSNHCVYDIHRHVIFFGRSPSITNGVAVGLGGEAETLVREGRGEEEGGRVTNNGDHSSCTNPSTITATATNDTTTTIHSSEFSSCKNGNSISASLHSNAIMNIGNTSLTSNASHIGKGGVKRHRGGGVDVQLDAEPGAMKVDRCQGCIYLSQRRCGASKRNEDDWRDELWMDGNGREAEGDCSEFEFKVVNLGKRTIHVNGKEVLQYQSVPLPHLALMEIGPVQLLFAVASLNTISKAIRRTRRLTSQIV